MKLHAPVVVGSLALLAACGGESPSSHATTVDSAGVTIVTNTSTQVDRAARWTLASQPALDVETPDSGAFTLFQIRAVVTLSGGRLAVANGRPPEILVFSPDGTLTSRFGKPGQGPGEFESINSIAALPGDSIAVYDDGAGRLSVFGPDGTFSHDASLAETITHSAASYADIHGLASGDLVFFTGGSFLTDHSHHDGVFRAESESMRIHSDGAVAASYGQFPGAQVFAHIRGASGSPFFAAVTDATTLGDGLIVGTEESTELRTYGPDGTLTRMVRWPDHDRTVTQERMDDFLDTVMTLVPEAQRAAARSMMAKMPRAEREPPYRTLVPADDGHVWVGDYNPMIGMPDTRPPPRHWLIFDAAGTLTATIDTPTGFEVETVTGDRVLGVFKNEMGVESIRAFAIQGM